MLGWGVLGCGDITDKRGAPAINAQEQSRLIGFQSRTAAQAEAFAARHGAEFWTTRREELLAHPDVTAVYVATEHHRHCEDVVAAAEAGKHVLCEKPLAASVREGRRMLEACRANEVALQVAYYRRYYPKLVRMREMLLSGAIGEPVSAHVHYSHRVTTSQLSPGNWRLNARLAGGGALADTGCHRLDLICWLFGEPDAVAALAECRELPIEAPDVETLLIRMACGVHVTTHHGFRAESEDRFDIIGTQGILSATPVDGSTLTLKTGDQVETWELPRHENVHFPLFDDFARRVAAGEPPQYSGYDGMLTTRIIEAAYESARTCRLVEA